MPQLKITTVAINGRETVPAHRGPSIMTYCETSADGLRDLIQQFDRLFDDSRRDMVRNHAPDCQLLRQLKSFYREANFQERVNSGISSIMPSHDRGKDVHR